MIPTHRAVRSRAVLAAIAEDGPTAALRLLADLYRRCPELRVWLEQDFTRSAEVRTRFEQLLDHPDALPTDTFDGFAHLNGEDRSWQTERAHLRQKGSAPRIYGGLTWAEMEVAFRRYEAGTLDLGTFLLAHQWNEARKSGPVSPELIRASAAFLDAVTRDGDRRLLKHYYRALSFLRAYEEVPRRRTAVGYAEWWKLRVLLYMPRHPRESYRTRDLRAHLATLGLSISSLDLRRFCTRHGIRRDMRAGRPRTRA